MPKDNEGKPIEQSVVQRVVDGVKYIVGGVTPQTWFGPGQPIQPVAQEVSGRMFDYPTGVNYRISPREGEIGYDTLRSLAESHDITRLAIETRKDQMEKLKWVVRMKDHKADADTEALKKAAAILAKPDREHPFGSWMRMLLEDLLVCDAPAIYVRPSLAGTPWAFEVVDGATIKRVIDQNGRTPLPPSPAFQQKLKGVPAVNYTLDEMVYLPRNIRSNRIYGMSPVQQIVVTVNMALRRQIHQLQFYTEGTVPEAIAEMPPEWTLTQVKEFQDWWDALLEGNTAARRHIKFIPGPAKLTFTKEIALKDEMDEWLARIVCYAFSLPPTPFVKQINRATAETAQEAALTEGLHPLMAWSAQVVNTLLGMFPGMEAIEFAWEMEVVKDELKAAQVHEIYTRSGILSIDDVLKELGKEPIGIGRGVLTPQGFVPLTMEYQRPAPGLPPGSPPSPSTPPSEATDEKPLPQTPEKAEKRAKKALTRISIAHADTGAIERYGKVVGHFLKAVGKKTAKRMARKFAELKKVSGDDAAVEAVLAELDTQEWAFLVDPTQKVMEEVRKRSGKLAVKTLGVGSVKAEELLTMVNTRAIAYAEHRAAEMVGMRWTAAGLVENPAAEWAITESTRENLRGLVVTALEEGWGPKELQEAITDSEDFSAERGMMVSRTELGFAHMDASVQTYRDSGMVQRKAVLLASNHNEPEDEDCSLNAAQGFIGFDEVFQSGDDAPPFHPNCLCDLDIEITPPEEVDQEAE